MKRATLILIEVKSCNASLNMILVFVLCHLKSVLRYKFLVLDTYHLDTLYLREQECQNPFTESIIHFTLHLLKISLKMVLQFGPKHAAGIIT
jgi:hypothetical protein